MVSRKPAIILDVVSVAETMDQLFESTVPIAFYGYELPDMQAGHHPERLPTRSGGTPAEGGVEGLTCLG